MAGLGCFCAWSELNQSGEALDRLAPFVNGFAVEGDPCVTHDAAFEGVDAYDQARIGSSSAEKAVCKQAPLETIRAQARSQARDPGTQRNDPPLVFVRPVSLACRRHHGDQPLQSESPFQHRKE